VHTVVHTVRVNIITVLLTVCVLGVLNWAVNYCIFTVCGCITMCVEREKHTTHPASPVVVIFMLVIQRYLIQLTSS